MTIEQELIEQKLFELLENQRFDDLSEMESEFVLRHMSEQEFKLQQESILLSISCFTSFSCAFF